MIGRPTLRATHAACPLLAAAALLATLALLAPAGLSGGQTEGGHERPDPPAADDRSREREYFSDVELVSQHGASLRFYSDLLQGKTVVINAFFTTCTGVCPLMSGKLAAIQEWLGDRMETEVRLLSISVDPETDTPDRLKAYADRFGARPGWYFLGGDKQNVDWALSRLGQYADTPEAHTNVIIVGNEPARVWRKAFGLADAKELIAVLDQALTESD
ncbi:MAG: SCO family protein [Thermoanaerobaculia bacterium]|nr:SCO family protein [Thermoanaerobaculia bacterium]